MPRTVALVTDSTASLPPEVAAERGIIVVPLQVVIGATLLRRGRRRRGQRRHGGRGAAHLGAGEHLAPDAGRHARGLRAGGRRGRRRDPVGAPLRGAERHVRVRPARRPGGAGAGDSRSTPASSGWRPASRCSPPRTSSRRAARAEEAAGAALDAGRGTTSLFYVDTLEYLRRGGRIGAAAALLGSALAVKPLLELDGRPDRHAGEGADHGPGAGPAGGAGRRGRRGPAGRRGGRPPRRPRPRGAAGRAGCAPGSPPTSTAARSSSARSAP